MAISSIKTTFDLRRSYPELVNQIADQARRDAVAAERARNAALEALDDPQEDIPELKQLISEAKRLGWTANLIQSTAETIKAKRYIQYMANAIKRA